MTSRSTLLIIPPLLVELGFHLPSFMIHWMQIHNANVRYHFPSRNATPSKQRWQWKRASEYAASGGQETIVRSRGVCTFAAADMG